MADGFWGQFGQNLGQGLSTSGEILSPRVYEEVARQRQMQLQNALALQRGQKELAARAIIAGVQSGSIDPQLGRQKLAQLGMGDIPVGPSLEAQGTKAFMDWQQGAGQPQPSPGMAPTPGMTPSTGVPQPAMPNLATLPPAALTSPAAGRYIQALQLERGLNKPQVHFDSKRNKLIQTYPDGSVREVSLGDAEVVQSGFGKELMDAGIKPGTPQWDAEWKKRVARETAPTQTQITLSNQGNAMGPDRDFWFDYYRRTKTLPPMAWGQAGNPTRQEFLTEYPKWIKANHPEDIGAGGTAASQAEFQANAQALKRVTTDVSSFEPYKKMLDTNADIAIQLGNKIKQTNAALINKPLNWLRQNASSNPDVAEYLAQMRFVQTEAARVINNPRIVGQLTDESRKEIEGVINGNAPIAVVDRVLTRLKIDGSNRFSKMHEQQQELMDKMRGVAAPTEPQTATPTQGTAPKVVDWGSLK